MTRRSSAGVLWALLWAGTALAQDQSPNVVLGKAVAREIGIDTSLTVFDDVTARVDSGLVTLTGNVTASFKASDLERRLRRITGVRQVQNDIHVLPVSIADDDLRFQIARAIYGHPAFWQYAAMVRPPVRILVEHGQVTLTGVVNNNVERTLAGSLANSCRAFSVRNDLKTDVEMRASPAGMQ
jgi:hyperosmotically inducible periplasmic protein